MTTALARQISTRMKAKNLTMSALEREAGLKTHTVQNILRGKSKKPSAEILQAVSDILGCTVKELLTQEFFHDDNDGEDAKNGLLDSPYIHPDLLLDVINLVNKKAAERHGSLTVQQVLTSVEEIYLHSLHKSSNTADVEFTDWFIDLLEG